MKSPIDLVPEEVKPPLKDGYRPDGSGQDGSRFDIVHPSGAPTIVGKVCGQGGPKTAGSAFTDRRASTPSRPRTDRAEPRDGEARRGARRLRAECRRPPVQDPDPTSGRVSEEVIESRAEVRPEVRVAREDVRRGLGVHTKARYTDNIMAITSANTTAKGLKSPGTAARSSYPWSRTRRPRWPSQSRIPRGVRRVPARARPRGHPPPVPGPQSGPDRVSPKREPLAYHDDRVPDPPPTRRDRAAKRSLHGSHPIGIQRRQPSLQSTI